MKISNEVALLYEISEALDEYVDLKKSLYKVLSVLSRSLNLIRGIIFLVDSEKDVIRIEVAHGIPEDTRKK